MRTISKLLKCRRQCAVALLAALVFCGANAQEDSPPPEKKTEKPASDPTQASDKLKAALKGPEQKKEIAKIVHRMPDIALRALILTEKKPARAILDVKGRHFTVSQGSVMSIPGDDGLLKISVKSVSQEGVTVEIPGTTETLTLK